MFFLALLLVAAAIVWAGARIAGAMAAPRAAGSDRRLELLRLFAPAIAGGNGADDARLLIAWRPVADAVRALYPAECTELDAAFGGSFPFTADRVQAAHARWTTDWLAWERAHDTEYKLKSAALEETIAGRGDAAARARVDALEREKLDTYQQRYAEYVRVSKAVQEMIGGSERIRPAPSPPPR